ncbi:hypothetical protein [Chitinophaga deserti]|uniref:hypothetical protein n=1 Tax=Chitinophaga deserti TaxID=2164099 RepID=UPI001300315C|nr:hypothetical protein [Chitinophaga deserti]
MPIHRYIWLPLLLAFFACHQPRETHRAFYHWKQRYDPAPGEKDALQKLDVRRMYIKCFDVDWQHNNALPVAVTDIRTAFPDSTLIVPVVFIMNEVWQRKDSAWPRELAKRTADLLQQVCRNIPASHIPEIQLDCDWTRSSREAYFAFLQAIRNEPFFQHRQLSATIRLHQVKYTNGSGVPPVDKGLLMCYNMGDLRKPGDHNSIIDLPTLESYTGNSRIEDYPLPLDFALPLFEWDVLFRQGRYAGLTRNMPLGNESIFRKTGSLTYSVVKDTAINSVRLHPGDIIRHEDSPPEVLRKAAKHISKQRQPGSPVIIFYHLDSEILNKYDLHELETIYRLFG